jgi:hypothetical protein
MTAVGLEPTTTRVKENDSSFPNRTCDFHRIRLSSGYSQRLFTITDFARLRPFPVYQTLPWSFEYYGRSVTLHLAMCR